MNELRDPLIKAFDFLTREGVDIPADIWQKSIRAGVFKQGSGELTAINKAYHDAIAGSLITYFEGGSLPASRNAFKRATVEAFGDAFDLGWVLGGGTMPPDTSALEWFNARVDAELGYIDLLFQDAKQLRKEEEFDILAWVSARADGYINTLKEIYNNAYLRAMDNKMVTFDGDDGEESCDTCQKLKGKRHKISWFISHNYIPPFGSGLDCAKGGHCQHFLRDDNGMEITI